MTAYTDGGRELVLPVQAEAPFFESTFTENCIFRNYFYRKNFCSKSVTELVLPKLHLLILHYQQLCKPFLKQTCGCCRYSFTWQICCLCLHNRLLPMHCKRLSHRPFQAVVEYDVPCQSMTLFRAMPTWSELLYGLLVFALFLFHGSVAWFIYTQLRRKRVAYAGGFYVLFTTLAVVDCLNCTWVGSTSTFKHR